MTHPDLTDPAAMIQRGKRSTLGSMRDEALKELRDTCTYCQGKPWPLLAGLADDVILAAERLKAVAALWQEHGQ
mgnify:CR=1 FL=1